jgi:hypothetical protein
MGTDQPFRSAVRGADRKKTGLVPTGTYVFMCERCEKIYKSHRPKACVAERLISGEPCGCTEFKRYQDIHVEAMPIGRVITDLRSPSQMGRKGKVK